jgi:hypothetical protein
MKKETLLICGEVFKKSITHFSFKTLYMDIPDMKELKKLKDFPLLKMVSLNGTNINNTGLKYISQCPSITNINLTFTDVSDEGIKHLTALKNLQYLRLKDTRITIKSIPYFNEMTSLKSLQIHETEISGKELITLKLPGLEELFVDCEDREDHEALLALSKKLTSCVIYVKGKGSYQNGLFEN